MELIDLTQCACTVLRCANGDEKARLTRGYIDAIAKDPTRIIIGDAAPDMRPNRPETPELLMAHKMPKRRNAGSLKNKILFLHAIAHIELNAIDLAWDILARFASLHNEKAPNSGAFTLPTAFYMEWLSVAGDEAKHFLLINDYLKQLGAAYGDYPAHDGLWEAAELTSHDIAARLAIVPMVLEARGLDVTPHMIDKFKSKNDQDTVDILQIILREEVDHVRVGRQWFEYYCAAHKKDVETFWQELVRTYFHGTLKRPFNHDDRLKAGMIRDWYEPLAD
mgnify:CR=1 FL=1|jgi:uncharacterized ferritin-like protein (DUF455 family)|tara:strand:- start:95146 stop:95982 length:837 start_codon:yes stop_codon:yes gene_type:complete